MKRNLQSMRQQDVPLHAEVAAVLRHQILYGDLPYGSKLPALRELTETLGVARMTIIQAMNTLEDEGPDRTLFRAWNLCAEGLRAGTVQTADAC